MDCKCGRPAIDGKLTCGLAQCGSSTGNTQTLSEMEDAVRRARANLPSVGEARGRASRADARGLAMSAEPLSPPSENAAVVPAPAPVEPPSLVSYEQFSAVDLRVGQVLTCERVPKKDRLLRLAVDVGETEPRTIVAGLGQTFAPEQLVARYVVVVANLAPREFGHGLVSHGMLLATGPSDKLVLATVIDGKPGDKLK